MTHGLRTWWTGLTLRERRLVGVAAALLVLVAVSLALRAGLSAGTDAREAHQMAEARAARVTAKAAMLKTMGAPSAASAITQPLDQYLTQSAADIGLTIDRNDARGPKRATVAIGAAKAQALIGWIAALEDQGVVVDRLSLTPGPTGATALTAELRTR